jgi:hypothetical protein
MEKSETDYVPNASGTSIFIVYILFIPLRVLMSELNQNYWVSGSCPSSGILHASKHNVSEIASVSASDEWKETSTLLGPLERANQGLKLALSKGFIRVDVSLPPSEDRDRSSFRNVVFTSI